jgi:hypothetical protein
MAFKVRDLMINVLPSDPVGCGPAGTCIKNSQGCIHPTLICDPLINPKSYCANSAPQGAICGACTLCTVLCTATCGCTHFSHCIPHSIVIQCGFGCTDITPICGPCTRHFQSCPGTSIVPEQAGTTQEASFAALSALKEELKQQLAEVEKQHTAAEHSLLPQTVEEVDMLTKKLQGALEELKSRRAELSNNPDKPDSAGD